MPHLGRSWRLRICVGRHDRICRRQSNVHGLGKWVLCVCGFGTLAFGLRLWFRCVRALDIGVRAVAKGGYAGCGGAIFTGEEPAATLPMSIGGSR